jgi:hypothetical protein
MIDYSQLEYGDELLLDGKDTVSVKYIYLNGVVVVDLCGKEHEIAYTEGAQRLEPIKMNGG